MYGWAKKKKDSHPAINAKASTITSETTWDMNPSANSIVQRTENGKKNLENIASRENGQDGRFSLKKPVEETKDLIAVHLNDPSRMVYCSTGLMKEFQRAGKNLELQMIH
jgi:hypothetical protein